MRLSKLLIPILIMATTVACSSLFKNDDGNGPQLIMQTSGPESQRTTFDGDTLVFDQDFYSVPVGSIYKQLPPFKTTIEGQHIMIEGYFLSPSGGYIPEGTLKPKGNALTIKIGVPEDRAAGTYAATGWFYNATLQNLDKGTYTVTIIHRSDLFRGEVKENHTIFTKEYVIE